PCRNTMRVGNPATVHRPVLTAGLLYSSLLFLVALTPPSSTLFPYTTLFRSGPGRADSDISRAWRGAERSLRRAARIDAGTHRRTDRKSTRLNSSHLGISYAVFCLKKKTQWLVKMPPTPAVPS